jgi:hypothetical protein
MGECLPPGLCERCGLMAPRRWPAIEIVDATTGAFLLQAICDRCQPPSFDALPGLLEQTLKCTESQDAR